MEEVHGGTGSATGCMCAMQSTAVFFLFSFFLSLDTILTKVHCLCEMTVQNKWKKYRRSGFKTSLLLCEMTVQNNSLHRKNMNRSGLRLSLFVCEVTVQNRHKDMNIYGLF